MNKQELIKLVEQLERRVRDLEARPTVINTPIVIQQKSIVPQQPWPTYPYWYPVITCSTDTESLVLLTQ